MSAESALIALLAADAALTAKVSQRISTDRIEQGAATPFIVIARIATEYLGTLSGSIVGERASLEIQCWASTRTAVELVAEDVERIVTADQRLIIGRASAYDPDLDLEASTLTIDWWD